jgi:hypothetical protein
MGTEEPTIRITAEEEIQAPLNQLPPNKALRTGSPVILADIYKYSFFERNYSPLCGHACYATASPTRRTESVCDKLPVIH